MILYKYASAEGGINILRERQLKVTRPRDFNDPFEFSPRLGRLVTTDEVLLRLQDPVWCARQHLEAMLRNENFPSPLSLLVCHEEHVQQVTDLLNRKAHELLRDHLEQASEDFAVICLSETFDSISMWSHYADRHEGIVIGFESAQLANGNWWPVKYQRERVVVDAITVADPAAEIGAKQIFERKGEVWKCEKEFRAICVLKPLPEVTIGGRKERVLAIPEGAVASVKVGNRCWPRHLETIKGLLSTHGQSISLERATLHPTEERLVFEVI